MLASRPPRLAAGVALVMLVACADDPAPTATEPAAVGLADENITPSAARGRVDGSAGVDGAGNATYQVPIALPGGVNGVAPGLSLGYSSGGSDGFVGVGWRLNGLSAIAPCEKNLRDDGVLQSPHRYRHGVDPDEVTALCLDGERLVHVAGTPGMAGATYRPRRDPYTRVELHEEPAVDPDYGDPTTHLWWKAYGRDGLIYTYGRSERAVAEQSDHPYKWGLERVEDRFGNHWRVTYDRVDEQRYIGNIPDPFTDTVEFLPTTIQYTYTKDPAAPADPDKFVVGDRIVRFVYASRPQNDQYDIHASGALERMRRRLVEIRVEAAGREVRRYKLAYRNDSVSERSLLRAITECDAAGVCLPATSFEWQLGATTLTPADWPAVGGDAATKIDLTQVEQMVVLDADHDGHDEIMFTYGEWPFTAEPWQVWDPDENTMWVAANALGTRGSPTLDAAAVDFNGDAYADVAVPVADAAECGDCQEDAIIGSPVAYATRIQILYGTGSHQMQPAFLDDGSNEHIYITAFGDFDGDGLTDAYLCRGEDVWATTWQLALNRPGGSGRTFVMHPDATPAICSNYEWYLVLDADGDGADELLVRDPEEKYPDDGLGTLGPMDQFNDAYSVLDFHPWSGGGGLPIDVNQHMMRDVCHPEAFVPDDPVDPFDAPTPYEWLWPQAFPGPNPDKIADVNGDGLDDVIRLELDPHEQDDGTPVWTGDGDDFECRADEELSFSVRVYLNTGRRGFELGTHVAATWHDITPWHAMRRFQMMSVADVNFDHRADLVSPDFDVPGGTSWEVHVGRPSLFGFQTQPLPLQLAWDHDEIWELDGNDVPSVVLAMRAGGSGLADLVGISGANGEARPVGLTASGAIPDHIDAVVDGLGARDRFVYGLANDATLHVPGQTTPEVGLMEQGLLVREHQSDLGLTGTAADAYTSHQFMYYEGRYDRLGRGSLGFQKRTIATSAVDPGAPQTPAYAKEEVWYDQAYVATVDDFPWAGKPRDVVREWKITTPTGTRRLVHHDHTDHETKGYFANTVFAVRSQSERDRQHDLSLAACSHDPCRPVELGSAPAFRDVTTTRSFDDWGNTTVELVKTAAGHEDWTVTTYDNVEAPWLLGLARRVEVTSEAADGTFEKRTTAYDYVAFNTAVKIVTVEPDVAAQRLVTTYERNDIRGLVTKVIAKDAANVTRTSELTWDPKGHVITATKNLLGQTELFVHHDGLGVLTHYLDAAETVHETTYDGFGRPSGARRRTFAGGPTDGADRTTELLAPGPVTGSVLRVKQSQLGGGYILRDLDRLGRQIRSEWVGMGTTFDGTNVYQLTAFDDRGMVKSKSVPQWVGKTPPGYVTSSFDNAGRITSSVAADGATVTWSYDNLRTRVTDADGRLSTYVEDQAGDVVSTVDAGSTTTCLDRGPFGWVAKVRRNCGATDGPKPAATVYTYDRFGRVTAVDDPITGVRSAGYDAWGDRRWAKDAKNQQVNFVYDKLGRLTTRTNAVEGATTFTYDTTHAGRLAKSVSADGVERRYSYDDLERPIALETVIAGETFRFDLTYDTRSRISTVSYPKGANDPAFTIRYTYDTPGYMRVVTRADNNAELWRAVTGTPRGPLDKEQFGNGTATRRSYDALSGRLTRLVTDPVGGAGAPLQDDNYAWTPAGDLDWRRDDVNAQLEDFTYDSLHRLTIAKATKGAASRVVTTSYDRLGNITLKSDVGSYTYDPAKLRLATAGTNTFTWDANGDLATRNGSAFTFTTFGKVKTMPGGVSVIYDADGQRVRRTDATGLTHITLDDLFERETSPSGPIEHKYLIKADGRSVAQVSRLRSGNLFITSYEYLHRDHLGTPVLVTDEAGAVQQRMSFDAWGKRRSATNWTSTVANAVTADVIEGFTGHPLRTDTSAGLIDMNARMYDPTIGRFVSPDPIVVDPYNGQSYTPYVYVLNNPTSLVDPTGMQQTDPECHLDSTCGGNGEEDDEDTSDDCREGSPCEFPDEPVGGDPPAGPSGPGGGDGDTPPAGPPPTAPPAPDASDDDGGGFDLPNIPLPSLPLPDIDIPVPGAKPLGHAALGLADGFTLGGSTALMQSMGMDVPTASPYFFAASIVTPGGGYAQGRRLLGKYAVNSVYFKRLWEGGRKIPRITIPFNSTYSEAVQHAIEVSGGAPMVFKLGKKGKDVRRRMTLRGHARVPGKDRDEWPMAMFIEGAGADVRAISPSSNRALGAYIGNMVNALGIKDGKRVEIVLDERWFWHLGLVKPGP